MFDEAFSGLREHVVVPIGNRVPAPPTEDQAGVHIQISDDSLYAFDARLAPFLEQLARPCNRRDLVLWLEESDGMGPEMLLDAVAMGLVVVLPPLPPSELIDLLAGTALVPLVPLEDFGPVAGRQLVTAPNGTRVRVWTQTAAAVWEEPAQLSLPAKIRHIAEAHSTSSDGVANSVMADLHALLVHGVAALRQVGTQYVG